MPALNQNICNNVFLTGYKPSVLDVSFQEDMIQGCEGYSAENLALVRHLAVNLLTHENTAKGGIHAKRKKAGWDNKYLTLVLNSLSDST